MPWRWFGLLTVLCSAGACFHASPDPLPVRPPVVEAEPFEIGEPDFTDLTGLEPAPFPVPAGDSILTSDAPSPEGLNLSGTVIPLEINPRVQFWIDIFTGRDRERFALYLARQGRYQDMITSRLRARGLPEELLYLALIESGYSPIARSRANAVGMWQFVAGTARLEGLEVSEYVDERRHAERSTDAAINHLEKLYDRFGSWYLAAAAYNSGEGRVARAMTRRGRGLAGHDSLFWLIHRALPRETRDYVPKLIAATIIGRNRAEFGFADVVPLQPEAVDRVTIPDATDLGVVADAAGVEEAEINRLNPHLPRRVTPPGRPMEVFLPAGTAPTFEVAYAEIPPEKRVRFLEHTVRRGETLSHIALRYGTSVRLIQETNGIRRPDRLSIGQRLRIPRSAVTARVSAPAASPASSPAAGSSSEGTITYRVRRGDSLWLIARRYGVSTKDLMTWNSLTERSILHPGDRIIIRRGS